MLKKMLILAGVCAGAMYGGTIRFEGTAIPAEENAVKQIQNVVALQKSELPNVILRYDETFGEEEWKIERKDGGDIYIYGGRTRGVLYGAIDFIEKYLGAVWVSIDYTYIPDASTVFIPKDISIHMKPAMEARDIYCYTRYSPQNVRHYHSMLRMNSLSYLPENGYSNRMGSPKGCHVYYLYAKDLPLEHCWTNPKGEKEPTKNDCEGQICYTDPYVRDHFVKKLREYIEADKVESAKKGQPFPLVYDLSANDCMTKCYCEKCCAIEKEHGLSAVVLDFTNAVAEAISKDYPNIKVQCFAYKDTMIPPKNFKVHDNVIVRLAYLDKSFDHFENDRDVLKPLSHPQNQWYKNTLLEWSKCANNIAVWDYWKFYHDGFISPIAYIRNRAEYMKLYKQINAKRIFIESEIDYEGGLIYSFKDMEIYVGAHLMVDPDLDIEMLIAKYMNAAYGPAAGVMQEYLRFLEQETQKEDRSMECVPVQERTYLTPDFFARCNAYLDAAEKLALASPKQFSQVQQERLSVDIAYASMFKADDYIKERILRNLNAVITSHSSLKDMNHPARKKMIDACMRTLK